MDTTVERTIAILNDLILINSDRSTAYEKAMKQTVTEDPELAKVFKTMAADSRKYLYELAGHLDPSGQEFLKVIPPTSGRIYQEWSNERKKIVGKDRETVVASSKEGEKAIGRAYDEAMKEAISDEVKQVIAEQKNNLRKALDRINSLQQVQPV